MHNRKDGIPTLMSGVSNRLLDVITPADVKNEMMSYVKPLSATAVPGMQGKLYILPEREKYDKFDSCDFE